MKDKSKLKYISIQSKISPEAAESLDCIVKKYNFKSRYEVMQYLLSSFLLHVDPGYRVTEEVDSSMITEFSKIFEDFENKKHRVIDTRPSGRRAMKMVGSIYIFSEIGRRGYIARNMKMEGDCIRMNSSNTNSLEMVMKYLYPNIASQLLDYGRTIGECRYEDIIQAITSEKEKVEVRDILHDEIDNELKEESISIEYGNVPKRRKNRSVNNEQGL